MTTRKRLLVFLAASLGTAAIPAMAQSGGDPTPVSESELNEFLHAVEERDPERLRTLLGMGIGHVLPGLEVRLTSAEDLLAGLEGCSRHLVQRFDNPPDVFVQWVCPGREWSRSPIEVAGYTVRLWHGSLGLSLVHGPDGIVLPGRERLMPRSIERPNR